MECRSYTHARRHPFVIGKVGGTRIPPQTPTQIATELLTFAFLLTTRRAWVTVVPAGVFRIVVLFGVPALLGWVARRVRFEGRHPLRALLGIVKLLAAPKHGRVDGRAWRGHRPDSIRGTAIRVGDYQLIAQMERELGIGSEQTTWASPSVTWDLNLARPGGDGHPDYRHIADMEREVGWEPLSP